MKNLTTNIPVPNIVKWKVLKVHDNQDDDAPSCNVTVQFLGVGAPASTYAILVLPIYDVQPSIGCFSNATPASYNDRICTVSKVFDGAYTVIAAANKSAGNRNAQLQAVEAALLTTGIIDPVSLAST